jgi:membrane-associated phospholipid phosphatase
MWWRTFVLGNGDGRIDTMSLRKRLVWLVAIFFAQALYFPINRTVEGGVVLVTPLDAWVPFWPVWAVPYILSLFWWAGCFVWAALKMPASLYRALMIGVFVTLLTSYTFYIIYPTYVVRPPVEGTGWQFDLIRAIYANDRLNNAFPSSHTYMTVLIVLFWWNWQPKLRWLWLAIAVIIVLSTLFTGQHHLPDPVGGIAWAWMGSRLGLWWERRGGVGIG